MSKSNNNNIYKQLKPLITELNKNYITSKSFEEAMNMQYSIIERRFAETKSDILQLMIKGGITQISVIVAIVFALLDFFLKK